MKKEFDQSIQFRRDALQMARSLTSSNASIAVQSPCALRVPALRGDLRRCRSSTMSPHRLRRGALHLTGGARNAAPPNT